VVGMETFGALLPLEVTFRRQFRESPRNGQNV